MSGIKLPIKPENWLEVGTPLGKETPNKGFIHKHNHIVVISSFGVTSGISKDLVPQYIVSIAKNGKRCTAKEAQWALKQFDLADALEDNHTPFGIARKFYRPLDESLVGTECDCANEGKVFKEGDYNWSVPNDAPIFTKRMIGGSRHAVVG